MRANDSPEPARLYDTTKDPENPCTSTCAFCRSAGLADRVFRPLRAGGVHSARHHGQPVRGLPSKDREGIAKSSGLRFLPRRQPPGKKQERCAPRHVRPQEPGSARALGQELRFLSPVPAGAGQVEPHVHGDRDDQERPAHLGGAGGGTLQQQGRGALRRGGEAAAAKAGGRTGPSLG